MMKTTRFYWPWSAAVAVTAIFMVLLAFRLELLSIPGGGTTVPGTGMTVSGATARDTWMNISQQGQKIGYAHRTFVRNEEGYRLREEVFMRVQTMGVVQGIALHTEGVLDGRMNLTSFSFQLRSNLFAFQAEGRVTGRRLVVVTRTAGDERRHELSLKEPVHLAQGLLSGDTAAKLAPGQEIAVAVFDPMTMGSRPVKILFSGEETKTVMGRPTVLRKYAVDFMDARQYAWLDGEGAVVREEGMLKMALEKTSRDEALAGLGSAAAADLTDLASIDAGAVISDPSGLRTLVVAVDGIETRPLMLSGGRQHYGLGGLLTVRREERRPHEGGGRENPEGHLGDTPFIQTNHPEIRAQAQAIVAGSGGNEDKARRIVDWVYRNIAKRPVLSVSNAVETLRNRAGDCTEHAVLTAALARAAGIPAQLETGVVYQKGRFYYHAWNVFRLADWGGWVTADAVMNQLPADVTHLRLVRGEAEQQLDLMGVVGRMKLKIKEMSP